MRRQRDLGIIWVVVAAAVCYYALYQHETLVTWFHHAILAMRRKY